jgi:thiamine biosynthesis lipoprotein
MSTAGPDFGNRLTLSGATMGTRFAATLFPSSGLDVDGLRLDLQHAVDTVDNQMSTWKPGSDLMRFNALPVGDWFDLPTQLEEVLATAFEVGRLSSDAFDVGVGDVVSAWGFGPAGGRPDREAIAIAQSGARVPARLAVELDRQGRRARKRQDTTLDLSGIAKGYGVDELARALEAKGVRRYLVSIDGELRAAGGKPDGRPWCIALEAPVQGRRQAAGLIEIWDGALATSGDYRQSVDLDGIRWSHTIDPLGRRPLGTAMASVTVRSRSCMEADAWATALTVIGPGQGLRLANPLGIDAVFAAGGHSCGCSFGPSRITEASTTSAFSVGAEWTTC